jgi:hypothetical protein
LFFYWLSSILKPPIFYKKEASVEIGAVPKLTVYENYQVHLFYSFQFLFDKKFNFFKEENLFLLTNGLHATRPHLHQFSNRKKRFFFLASSVIKKKQKSAMLLALSVASCPAIYRSPQKNTSHTRKLISGFDSLNRRPCSVAPFTQFPLQL